VRAARVRPQRREGDLARRALLQEELVPIVEKEDAERAVENPARLLRDEPVRGVLAVVADDVVLVVLWSTEAREAEAEADRSSGM
jgi:hypothetical protein